MAAQIIAIIATATGQCAIWFNQIVEASGSFGIYISALFLFSVGRFLLGPIFGTAVGVALGNMGSDKVYRRHRDIDAAARRATTLPKQKRLN